MTAVTPEMIQSFVTDINSLTSNNIPISESDILTQLNHAGHATLKKAILTPASTVTKTRILSALTMIAASIAAYEISDDDNVTSDILFYSTAATILFNIIMTSCQQGSQAETLGGLISFIVSILTGIMPLGKRPASTEVTLSIVASYIANQILYWVDVPKLLSGIYDWFNKPLNEKMLPALDASIRTIPWAFNATYFLLADMHAGLREISEEADSPLVKVMFNDPKWQVLLLAPTAFAIFAFHAAGLKKTWDLIDDYVFKPLISTISSCCSTISNNPDLNVPILTPTTDQQPTKDTTSLYAWGGGAAIFACSIVLANYSQTALIDGIKEAVPTMPAPLLETFYNNTKNLKYATITAKVTRVFLCWPKYFIPTLDALNFLMEKYKATPAPAHNEEQLSKGEIASKINSTVIKKVITQHPAANQKSFKQSFFKAIYESLKEDEDNQNQILPSSYQKNCKNDVQSLFNRHSYTIKYGIFSIALIGNGLNNFYLCDTLMGGAMNGASSIYINAFSVLALYASDVAVQIYNENNSPEQAAPDVENSPVLNQANSN